MSKVSEFLAQASHYIDEGSAAVVEQLTDEQFAIIVAATDEISSASEKGASEPGIDSTLVRTNETLIDFDTSRAEYWAERGSRQDIDLGAPAVRYEHVQMLKGQPRHHFIVIDLGEYRVVVK